MKKRKVKTKKLRVPQWQAGLFISLFYSDGGDGYSHQDIESVCEIINEEHLLSLVEISDPVDGKCICTFITEYSQ